MTTLSIALPNKLAEASQEVARKLGLSRTEFIRQAIAHELEAVKAKFEQEAIIKSFNAMKQNQAYLSEADELDTGFDTDLPKDGDDWWNG